MHVFSHSAVLLALNGILVKAEISKIWEAWERLDLDLTENQVVVLLKAVIKKVVLDFREEELTINTLVSRKQATGTDVWMAKRRTKILSSENEEENTVISVSLTSP